MLNATVLPMAPARWSNPLMLTGVALGQALRKAMTAKGLKQADVAKEFGIKQPSVSEWIKYGRIGKQHIPHVVKYFSTHVGPEHWGLPTAWQDQSAGPESVAEAALLRKYRALGGVGRALLEAYLDGLNARESMLTPAPTKRAAGRG